LDVAAGALVVGDAGNGTLGIYAGGYVDAEGTDSNGVGVYIGNQGGSNGTVTVSGYANTFDSEMDVEEGALVVGNSGNGTLGIYDGGVVDEFGEDGSDVGIYVGNQTGSNGNLTVDGVNTRSHFSSELYNEDGALMAGNAGNGTLSITGGGYVDALGEDDSDVGVYVGNQGGSNGNVSVSGVYFGVGSRSSELQVDGALVVGNYGNGTVSITDSGYVLAEGEDENGVGVYIGNQTGSVGNVSVDGKDFVGPPSELSITDGALVVGNAGNGTLSVTNDGNVDVSGEDGSDVGVYVGNQTGSNGNITVSGLTSHTLYSVLSVDDGALVVGNGGNGSVEIDTGAYVAVYGEDLNDVSLYIGNQTGSNGKVTVTGYVSPYPSEMDTEGAIEVGNAGNGTLGIFDGGLVNVHGDDYNDVGLYIGNQSSSLGVVTVDGVNATTGNSSELDVIEGAVVVGNYGNGTLSVTNGGNVDVEEGDGNDVGLYIGNQTGGVGNVTVDGFDEGSGNVSELTVDDGAVVVGNYGNGTLSVSAGAFLGAFGSDVADVSVYIGNQAYSNGNVTVDGGVLAGPTQMFVQGDLVVGNGGNGSLDISNGGYVNVYGDDTAGVGVYIGNQTCSNGYVSVTGVSLGNESTLDVATGAGALVVGNYGNGTLDIGGGNGGVVTVSSFLILASECGSKGTVNINTNGTLQVGGTNGIQAGAGCSSFNLLGGTVQVIGSDLTTSVAAKLGASTTSMIDTNGWNATWTGALSGSGALEKIGAGTLTLTAASSYEGGTIVAMGKLVLTDVGSGSVLGTGPLNVEAGATLAGNGRVDGDATISGNLSPGNSPGLITFGGNLTLNSGSFTNMELAGNTTPGTDYDSVNVTGNLTTGGRLTVSLINGFSPSRGDSFDLFNVSGTITGSFGQVSLPFLGGGLGWDTSQLYSVGDISVVPEPAAWGLALGAGMMAWAMWRRRGREKSA
jgi:T5SS/PEP-CTERM-associated repeat protein/autotransporter-associated beta strand protein